MRGITSLGLGPASEVLRFVHNEELGVQTVPNNSSVPSSTATNNTYIIIAIVVATILVFLFLLAAVVFIYRKRNISKCPHYFNKGDGSGGPWTAYAGCWEDASTTGGISTTLNNDGTTVTSLNNARYTDGTLTALGNIHYGHGVNGANGMYGSDGRSQFYATTDTKSAHHDVLRTSEDLMYEDPEGLRLVSFKGRHNQRCRSPEPYATTPLITGSGGTPIYPRSLRTDKNITRLPPNIPHMLDQSHNFNSHSDKGSMSSGPVLQFPPPPPPPLSGGETSTSTSTNSKGGGGSLFLQHLPYHPTNDSNSSHQTSPLLLPKQGRNPRRASPHQPNPLDSKKNNYNSQSQGVDPLPQAKSLVDASLNRAAMEDWLSNGGGGLYPPVGRCHSPQSSALGDAEESDDKDDSCWSEGTNDNDGSTTNGSLSSLQPDINWTEAMRLMSENKWPEEGLKRQGHMEDGEVNRQLLQPEGDYYCQVREGKKGPRSSSKKGNCLDPRYESKGHSRNTSLSSPLV